MSAGDQPPPPSYDDVLKSGPQMMGPSAPLYPAASYGPQPPVAGPPPPGPPGQAYNTGPLPAPYPQAGAPYPPQPYGYPPPAPGVPTPHNAQPSYAQPGQPGHYTYQTVTVGAPGTQTAPNVPVYGVQAVMVNQQEMQQRRRKMLMMMLFFMVFFVIVIIIISSIV